MTLGIRFKEVYIHLSEDERALVCTVRYGGLIEKATQFRLEMRPSSPQNLVEKSLFALRTRNRRATSPRGER